jgi:glutamyl-Q tRNA(Asp) synthetase
VTRSPLIRCKINRLALLMEKITTRFAPSPTGYLHLGHAASAIEAYDFTQANGGRFILRVEDIDQGRCRTEYIDALYEDLAWLGLRWETPVRWQSQHFPAYQSALQKLQAQDLVYPCFCSRADITAAIAAPHGPDAMLYPGTCKHLENSNARIAAGEPHAWRLHVDRAVANAGPLTWRDRNAGTITADAISLGDVVLARKETPTSYHLAVTVDDALQGITHVVRGQDLFHATHIHRLLQAVLNLPTPVYYHHPLLLGTDGKRLAKRNASQTLRALRQNGITPTDIRAMISAQSRDPMPLASAGETM